MYESYERLKIKEKAGITAATKELQYRNDNKELLPLKGMQDVSVYMVQTEEIKNKLDSIESLYKQISNEKKVKDIILLDAFHSATIEGARTTVENVRKAYDTPKTKDDKMVINTIKGMYFSYENKITMQNIRKLWEIVTDDVCDNSHLAGSLFRDGMVYVGSNTDIIHTPAKPEIIENMMRELFEFMNISTINIWIKAAISHFYFVYIHPFCDGNGRTIRIMTQSMLKHEGKEKIQFLSLSRTINDNLSGYYTSLKDSENIYTDADKWMDITPFIDYMLDAIEKCMIVSLKEENVLSDTHKLLLNKMYKRGTGAEITLKNASDILKSPIVDTEKYLNELVDMGYLEIIKREQKSVYILK